MFLYFYDKFLYISQDLFDLFLLFGNFLIFSLTEIFMKIAAILFVGVACSLLYIPKALSSAPALICTSDSTGQCAGRQYCCYEGMSDSDGDKYCKNLGCRRGGTASCPTAANVKSCGTRDKSSVEPNQITIDTLTNTLVPLCIEPIYSIH